MSAKGIITDDEFKAQLGTERANYLAVLKRSTESMSLADDHIDDKDIGPFWAEHFPKLGENLGPKVIVISLLYIIEESEEWCYRWGLVGSGFTVTKTGTVFRQTSSGKSKASQQDTIEPDAHSFSCLLEVESFCAGLLILKNR